MSRVRPLIIIIPMSHPFVMHLVIIHMFHTSVMPSISLDQYLNPILYTIPNMQNMRFFLLSSIEEQNYFVLLFSSNFRIGRKMLRVGGKNLE